jgi:hypothetical protein
MKYTSCLDAVIANDLQELKKMREAKYQWPQQEHFLQRLELEAAAKTGNLELFEYCYDESFDEDRGWNNAVERVAARYGHLNILKFIIECLEEDYDPEVMIYMVCEHGHLECLKYLQSVHQSEWFQDREYEFDAVDAWDMEAAAKNGHLECIKYLREWNCAWDDDCCVAAARGGHVDCLKYMRENGCEWNQYLAVDAAVQNIDTKGIACLQYIIEHTANIQKFWKDVACVNPNNLSALFAIIDLDERIWRSMLEINIDGFEYETNEMFLDFVHQEKRKIAGLCHFALQILTEVPTDVVKYCLNCYI